MFEADSDVPDYVPIQNRQIWRDAWNAAFQAAIDEGQDETGAEVRAYLAANAAAIPAPEAEPTKEAAMEKLLKYLDIFQVIEKVDGTHCVIGIATSDVVDKDGERADYEDTRKNIAAWSDGIAKTTSASGQEISLGNIRVQHDSKQIGGKVTAIEPNDSKHYIVINTQPRKSVYDDIIKTGMVSGFSIAGTYDYRKCDDCETDIMGRGKYCNKCKKDVVVRYAPSLSEISYVDNPCNPDAQFTHVKASGAMEIVKSADLRKSVEQLPVVSSVGDEIRKALIDYGIIKEAKTKRVAGEDLAAGCFAYVGDKEDTSTWKLPYKCFSTDAKNKSHVRNALARFNQTQGIPASAKAGVKAKLVAAAKKHGIEVSDASKKAVDAALVHILCEQTELETAKFSFDRSAAKAILAGVYEVIGKAAPETEVIKGMYTVGSLAEMMQSLQYLVSGTEYERDYEGDDSTVPDDLRGILEDLVPVFIAMASEEAKELLTQNKTANGGLGGKSMTTTDADLLKAAKERVIELWKKAKSLFHKMAKEHGHLGKCMEKAAGHHENLAEQHADMCAEGADKAIKDELQKLGDGAEFKKMAKVDQIEARLDVIEKAATVSKAHKGLAKMGKCHAGIAKCMSKAADHCGNLDKAAVDVGSADDAIDMQSREHEEGGAHGGGSEKTAAQIELEKKEAERIEAEALAKAKAGGNKELLEFMKSQFDAMKAENKTLTETLAKVQEDVKKQGDKLEDGPAAIAKRNALANPGGSGREGGNGNGEKKDENVLSLTAKAPAAKAAGMFGR